MKFNSVKFFIYLHAYLTDLRPILKEARDKEETKKDINKKRKQSDFYYFDNNIFISALMPTIMKLEEKRKHIYTLIQLIF
jgi:hypothetical protein